MTHPCMVTEIKQTDLKDWTPYLQERYNPITHDKDKTRVKIHDVHWMVFGWAENRDPVNRKKKRFTTPKKSGFTTDFPGMNLGKR